MRKTVLLASAAALVLAVFSSCSGKDDTGSTAKGEKAAAKVEVTTGVADGHATPMAQYIRYVDTQKLDSLYVLSQEVHQADSIAQIKLASYQNQLAAGLQRRQQQIQEKAQRNGYLTEQSYNADIAALQKAQQDAENSYAQRSRDYAMDLMAKQQQLNDSLMSVINHFAVQYKLDAILQRGAGLYFNPALDITDEVLAELNRRYKASK